ncbi:PTS glucose transporter subunit IIA [Streptomyces sp. NPDC047000]|uniref:PTS sugar transporter subunit IIA n=1 Tax=Streptomyces sp. NPDC047000 TaxID=3155474 RepID=UPI0033F95E39
MTSNDGQGAPRRRLWNLRGNDRQDSPATLPAGTEPSARSGQPPAPAGTAPSAAGTLRIGAPVTGELIALSQVGDPAFSAGLLGPGMGVRPSSGEVTAPVGGALVSVMPHAYGLRTPQGLEVLVHVGIDTVSLKGRHFDPLVEQGQQIEPGQALVRVDVPAIVEAGLDPTVIVVVTNADSVGGIETQVPGPVESGQAVATVTL